METTLSNVRRNAAMNNRYAELVKTFWGTIDDFEDHCRNVPSFGNVGRACDIEHEVQLARQAYEEYARIPYVPKILKPKPLSRNTRNTMPKPPVNEPSKPARTSILIPPRLNAWVLWQAATEQTTRDALIVEALTQLHKQRAKADPRTPSID